MLIVENVGLPITSGAKVYDNVMEVWTKALTTVDKLVAGMAQNIQSSDVLLGLSAWHLYPDMCILGKETTSVQQGDNLVKHGGLMTFGIRRAHSNESTEVSWSMPLAHLRYYGKPVLSEGSISSKSTRIPFDRLVLVAIGSLISTWGLKTTDFDDVARFLILLCKFIEPNHKSSFFSNTTSWLELLSQHASGFLASSGHERIESSRLIALGCRRFGSFLAEPNEQPKPFFGISDLVIYLDLVQHKHLPAALREIVSKYDLGVDLRGAFVRYHGGSDFTYYASLFPQNIRNGTSNFLLHRRWIQVPNVVVVATSGTSKAAVLAYWESEAVRRSVDLTKETGEPCGVLECNTITEDDKFANWSGTPSYITSSVSREWAFMGGETEEQDENDSSSQDIFENAFSLIPSSLIPDKRSRSSTTEDKEQIPPETLDEWDVGASKHQYGQKEYRLLFRVSSAAVYQPNDEFKEWEKVKFSIKLADIINLLTSDSVRRDGLVELLSSYETTEAKDHASTTALPYFKSLENLHFASEIYSSLSGSEIDMPVLSTALHNASWGMGIGDDSMLRARSFACIAMFETGGLNLRPQDFEAVVAISSGNTLYVSELLLCDPHAVVEPHLIRCLVGNVGKPGLSLLLLPKNPIHREPDLDTWELVNHAEFDGLYEDNFKGTSLHLSLTGYEQALNIGKHGGRDKEVCYLEAVIAALDNGTWVADLDVLYRTFQTERIFWEFCVQHDEHYYLPTYCRHKMQERADFASNFSHLTSIDNWFEVFDRPSNASIVRARGNWIARLALATVMTNQKTPMIIGSQEICWACVRVLTDSANLDPKKQVFLC